MNGLKWCQKNTKDRKCYITRADKGGAILILDATMVDSVIKENLQNTKNYKVLDSDPRADIRQNLISILKSAVTDNIISSTVLHYITGVIDHEEGKDGYSHSHVFQIAIPYIYPLFKIHKLSLEALYAKTIPPSRMVTGSTNGPTYRLGVYIDSLLKPIAMKYCAPEIIKDTTTFIKFIESQRLPLQSNDWCIGNMDIVALYPSIPKNMALKSVEHALESAETDLTQKKFILEVVKFSIENSVIRYRDIWYKSVSELVVSQQVARTLVVLRIYL